MLGGTTTGKRCPRIKNIINKFKRFCKTELGLHTREDFFSALCAVMFAGGMVTAGLILVYIFPRDKEEHRLVIPSILKQYVYLYGKGLYKKGLYNG